MSNTLFTRKKLRAGTAMQSLVLLGAGVVASAAFVAPASAQDFQTVTASGKVQGTNGQPITGATVSITSNGQGFTRTTQTDGSGSYRVPQLPAGTYTFTVSADGFDTFTDSNVPLNQTGAGNTFTLAVTGGAPSGDIVVTAGRTKVADFEQTTTGGVINVSELANRVPVARDLTSIIQLTPGTAQGDSAFGNLASINGSSVGENQYFVNGLNITNFRTFLGSNSVPFEFYETVDVKDGGYQAEFGRSTGGFVSATTKSGSNEFHTGAVVTYAPDGLQSHAPNTLTADNESDYSSDLRADFYVSGPIIKDHLFFYGLYESRNVKSGNGNIVRDVNNAAVPGFVGSYSTSRTSSPFFAAKVDAVITDGQRLEFTYFRTKGVSTVDSNAYNSETNQVGGYIGTQKNQYGGDNYVARYTGSFTDWFTISAAYGKSQDRNNTFSTLPDTPYVENDTTASPFRVPGSNPFPTEAYHQDDRTFYRADADIYAHLFGSHHFRFGYDREDLVTSGPTSYTSGKYYQIFHTSSAAICGAGAPAGGCDYIRGRDFEDQGKFKTRNEAYYLEDSWSLLSDRLTLQLGIRNDRFNNRNVDGLTYYKSGNQWGPRIGAIFDPFGTKRTKLYFNFGRYFLPIAANTNIRLAGAEYDVYSYYGYGGQNADGTPILTKPITRGRCVRPDTVFGVSNNCAIVSDGTTASTASTVAQNLKPQSEDEYILGYEQKLGSHWTVGVYGTYRKLNRALEDSAIDGAARQYCRAQGFDAADCSYIYGGFSQYVLNNPGSDITTQITLPDGTTPTVTLSNLGYPKAKRKYEAITFKFDREFDGKWSIAGSYTYSKTLGNYEGSVTSDNGQTDAGLTQDFDQPELTYGAYGYLPNDRRHNFKIYGSYQLTDWLDLGANFQASSPRRFGCFGWLPAGLTELSDTINALYGAASRYCPYADGQVSAANPIVQVRRGTGPKSDWIKSLDLSAAITLPTDAFQGVLRFDVFNVFNSKGVTDLQEFGTQDDGSVRKDYGYATGYQAPRYGRVQLQLRF